MKFILGLFVGLIVSMTIFFPLTDWASKSEHHMSWRLSMELKNVDWPEIYSLRPEFLQSQSIEILSQYSAETYTEHRMLAFNQLKKILICSNPDSHYPTGFLSVGIFGLVTVMPHIHEVAFKVHLLCSIRIWSTRVPAVCPCKLTRPSFW